MRWQIFGAIINSNDVLKTAAPNTIPIYRAQPVAGETYSVLAKERISWLKSDKIMYNASKKNV